MLLCENREVQALRAGVLQNGSDRGDEDARKRNHGMAAGIALVCFLVVEMLGRDLAEVKGEGTLEGTEG